MSYILDALRRADAQRTRELLPGSGAQTTHVVFADTEPYRRGAPWPLIAGGCAVLLVGFVAWHFWPAAAPAGPAAPAQPAAPVATPVVVAQPSTPAIAQVAPVVAAPAPAAAAAPATASAPPVPAPAAATAATTRAATTGTVPAPAPVPAPTPAANANRVMTLDELPANLRAELPKLAITGSAYSDNAAMRLLIINGQVLHEKDEVARGLVLEQIQPKAAVLRYQGQRFQLPY